MMDDDEDLKALLERPDPEDVKAHEEWEKSRPVGVKLVDLSQAGHTLRTLQGGELPLEVHAAKGERGGQGSGRQERPAITHVEGGQGECEDSIRGRQEAARP